MGSPPFIPRCVTTQPSPAHRQSLLSSPREERERGEREERERGSSRGSCRRRSWVRRCRWSPHHYRTCCCHRGEARRRQLRRVSAAEPVVATATGSAKRERARETVAELPSPPRCWARHCPARAAAALPELLAAAVDGGNRLPSLCLLVIRSPQSFSAAVQVATKRIHHSLLCSCLRIRTALFH